jgi:predicted AlkP superfamily pyrophosphatase or phosphodiesterase
MNRPIFSLLPLLFAALACARAATSAAPPPALARTAGASVDRVIVVSVDGLMPGTYAEPDAHGLAVPTLREMARSGAWSPGARSVFPTVTYPAHTTMVTGVEPARHGVVTNSAWDPEERNQDGWRWYAEDIAVPTLWDAARAAGLKVALVNWPVTVGARADWLVPEYWRAGTADDAKLTRALSTPGLLARVAERYPDLWNKLTPPHVSDEATADIVVDLLEREQPNLVLAHIWQTDDAQHAHGPGSPEARAAVENADRQVGRVVAAARRSAAWERTVVVVVSDHGFAKAGRLVAPGPMLRDAGLVTIGENGHPTAWRAAFVSSGGTGFFYVADGDGGGASDPGGGATGALRSLLQGLVGAADGGVARLYEAPDLRARGGDPRAAFGIEAAPGFSFRGGYQGQTYPTAAGQLGQHGFDPERADMRASLIFFGGPVRSRRLDAAGLIDLAPTVARLLGFALPQATGRPLPVLDSPPR